MSQATITENGITTDEDILTSVADEETDNSSHEFIVWDDCSLTIESIEYVLTGDNNFDHVRLPLEGVLKLRDFLTSEHVTLLLSTLPSGVVLDPSLAKVASPNMDAYIQYSKDMRMH